MRCKDYREPVAVIVAMSKELLRLPVKKYFEQ